MSVSWTYKDHFQTAKNVSNANDLGLSVGSTLTYNKNRTITPTLEYVDYSTRDSSNSDYKYFLAKVKHKHSHKFDFWKREFKFTEGLSYRMKDFNNKDENLLGFSAKAATTLHKKMKGSLSLKHNTIDKTAGNANQTQIALGLSWSTP